MAATAIMAAAAVASIGLSAYEYASAPGMPKPPDMAAASRAGVEAQTETLPEQRAMEAAAQQGGKLDYQVAPSREKVDAVELFVPGTSAGRFGQPESKGWVQYDPKDFEKGGKYYGFSHGTVSQKTVRTTGGTRTADFTGFGQADIQSAIAQKNAGNILALQKKYDPAFIAEALKEQKLADPQGVAARERMGELIQQQVNDKPERPVADLLDQQVGEQLHAGNQLDSVSDQMLKDAIASGSASRGSYPDGATGPDYAGAMTTGFEGEARRQAANQKALSWLSSGATPEDVAYRREQQNLANESAFVNGRTPESQFQTLSGAQGGPAQYNAGQPLSLANPNAGAQMQGAQLQGWNTQMTAQENTANPWLAGVSAFLKGATAAGTAGYKPLATSSLT